MMSFIGGEFPKMLIDFLEEKIRSSCLIMILLILILGMEDVEDQDMGHGLVGEISINSILK